MFNVTNVDHFRWQHCVSIGAFGCSPAAADAMRFSGFGCCGGWFAVISPPPKTTGYPMPAPRSSGGFDGSDNEHHCDSAGLAAASAGAVHGASGVPQRCERPSSYSLHSSRISRFIEKTAYSSGLITADPRAIADPGCDKAWHPDAGKRPVPPFLRA